MSEREAFFSEPNDEIYKSLVLYLTYVNFKKTCPVTGTMIEPEYVQGKDFSTKFETKEFAGMVQLLYTNNLHLLSKEDILTQGFKIIKRTYFI